MAGTGDAVMMVEAGATGLPEDAMLEAVRRGHEALQPIIDLQERMVAAVGKPKRQFALATPPEDLGLTFSQHALEFLVQLVSGTIGASVPKIYLKLRANIWSDAPPP